MSKRSIYSVFFTLALILSACGSNEKEDGSIIGGGGNISGEITTSLSNITIDKTNGNISASVSLTSSYDSSVIVTLKDMNISLGGCILDAGTVSVIPESFTLDSSTATKDVKFTGTMNDPSCVPSSYQITGAQTLEQNGQSISGIFTAGPVNISSSQITFEKVSTLKLELIDTQVDMNESGIIKPIRLRVTKGDVGIKDQNIKISSLVNIGNFASFIEKTNEAGDAEFIYTAPTPIVDNNFTVTFCLEENTTMCVTAKINLITGALSPPADKIDDINYFITFIPNGDTYNLALDARNNAKVVLINKDTKEAIPSNRIKNITVTSKDTTILKLTPEGGGTPLASIVFGSGRNDVSVLMTADKFNAGLAPIEIVIEYFNLNGVLKTRGQLFSMAILSGAPTAFSINDDGVSYNAQTKQFEHKYIVQATDANSNPISTTGVINVSAMASFAKDAGGREILYGRNSGGVSATVSPDNGKAELVLVGLSPFNTTNIKESQAFVAIFGGPSSYEAKGKWNIEPGSLGGDTLKLNNAYAGSTHSGLGMAVGYNYRDKFCTSDFQESVVVVDSVDGKYQLNDKGQAVVVVNHDAYMIGKRIMLMVNMTGLNPSTGEIERAGEVHADTLNFNEPLKSFTTTIPKGAVDFSVTIPGVIVAGGDQDYVINSTFDCRVQGDDGIISINFVGRNDPASCAGNGVAFISYEITANGDGGSVTFDECQVNEEPNF